MARNAERMAFPSSMKDGVQRRGRVFPLLSRGGVACSAGVVWF
jgi:hypothetical protein